MGLTRWHGRVNAKYTRFIATGRNHTATVRLPADNKDQSCSWRDSQVWLTLNLFWVTYKKRGYSARHFFAILRHRDIRLQHTPIKWLWVAATRVQLPLFFKPLRSYTTKARLFDDDVPSTVVNLYSSFSSIIGAVLITYFWTGFHKITSASDMAWIVLMGVLGGTAVLLLVISYRMTEQSNLAPFSYFGIPLSFVLGWLFFNEAPWSTLFPGGILIVAGGLLIVWRERSQDKRKGAWYLLFMVSESQFSY